MGKIAFFVIPAHGHTNPTLAVVKELISRGNQVRYYGYEAQKDKIIATGAEYISCDSYDIQMKLKPEDGDRIGRDIAFSAEITVKTTLAMDATIIQDMAQWQPDCIVGDSVAVWGRLAAFKLGIPFMSSTTTFAFNQYSARIMKQDISQLFSMLWQLPKANRFARQLRTKGYPVKDFLSIIKNDNNTNTIVYTSPEFQPYSETFSDKYTFVGPSIRTLDYEVAKPTKKTVYISLGTVNNTTADFFKNCLAAFANTEYDVIMSVGENIDMAQLGTVPENCTVSRSVNQIEVLQKATAFITHCGMNSVNEALYYKVPLVLFPQTSEQGGVARRVSDLGAGLYLEHNTPEAIRAAVQKVLDTPSYAESAARISDSFHRCGGAKLAADKIEQLMRTAR